jgi:hypothetical protein
MLIQYRVAEGGLANNVTPGCYGKLAGDENRAARPCGSQRSPGGRAAGREALSIAQR